MATIQHINYVKILMPLAMAVSLVACSSSSNDDGEILEDTTVIPDPVSSPEPEPDATPNDSALDSASRIDIPRYEKLIEDVSAVENAGEFTSDNYALAIAAVAESSQSHVVFNHVDFLSMLERQVMSDDPPLNIIDVNDASLGDVQINFNRVHGCPDGGRLLATKYEQVESGNVPGVINVGGSDMVDISGEFTFEECKIGEIFIDGSYDSKFYMRDAGLDANLYFNGLSITGVDGALTTLSNSFSHTMQITDDSSSGAMYSSVTNMNTTSSVAVPSGGVVTMEISVQSEETAAADNAFPADVLPAETYNVRIQNAVVSVEGDTRVEFIANTVADTNGDSTNLNKALGESTFGQGEIEYVFSPRSNAMMLKADNSDPASFDVFTEQEDGSVVSFVVPWDSGNFEYGSLGTRMPQSWPLTTD